MKKALKLIGKFLLGLLILIFIFALSMYLITMGDYSIPDTVENNSSIPHIVIDDVVFHSETVGNDTNQVVIIIHGGPGNDYRYLLPLKELSKNYFVVFYDQRGTGLSPRVNANEHSLENSISDLASIIDYYSPEKKVFLIGHSWGAMLASGYIASNPHKVSKAVLAEPGMLTSEMGNEYVEKFKIEFNWQILVAMTIASFESLHLDNPDNQGRIDYIFGKIGTMDIEGNPMKKYFCNEDISSGHFPIWRLSGVANQTIMKEAIDENGEISIDLVSGLENYSNKVLFVVGECNQIIGKPFQLGHLKHFPNAEIVVVENAGHTMFGEKPEECIAIIDNYFNED